MNFFRILLLIFNIASTMIGIVLIAIGIWTATDKIYVASIIGDSLFSAVSYLLIVVGFIVMFVSIMGIYAMIKENLHLMLVYFGILCLSALLMLVAGILAVVFKSELESKMVDEMRETLISGYGSDSSVTDAWDQVQSDLKCCAISKELIGEGSSIYREPYIDGTTPSGQTERDYQDIWPIYKRTAWFNQQKGLLPNDKLFVPKSCCKKESGTYLDVNTCQTFSSGAPGNYQLNLQNHYLHEGGCYEKAKNVMMDHVDILAALGFVFAVLMIAGICVTFLVIRDIKSGDDDEVKRRREPDNF